VLLKVRLVTRKNKLGDGLFLAWGLGVFKAALAAEKIANLPAGRQGQDPLK
jgi:hypothetical protein